MKKYFILLFSSLLLAPVFSVSAQQTEDVMSPKYREIWNDSVQTEIDARIEKYRKADYELELSDVQPGTEVKIEQIRHQFLFGAHIFNFDQLGTDERNAKYKELFGTLFNAASVALYWEALEPEPGHFRYQPAEEDTAEFWNNCPNPTEQKFWRRPPADTVVDFCLSKNIAINGHTLIWAGNLAHWVPQDPEKRDEMEKLFEERIRGIAEHFGDKIPRYDVVNESSADFGYEKPAHRGEMPFDYAYKAFRYADTVFPKSVKLNINDYVVNDHYADQVNDLVERGCRVDIVGVQSHLFDVTALDKIAQGEEIYTPEMETARLSAADKAHRPLHLSEITLPAPSDDDRGRAVQAEVARNLYRFWFSWPSMMGITWWNTVDECGWAGEPTTSGLFTRNMDPKPSYFALNHLINEEWKTNITAKSETSDFQFSFRGFKGTYRVTWTSGSGNEESKEFIVE